MKSIAAILALAATSVFGAAIDTVPKPYNLTLVLDVDDTGTIPVWRLTDKNIPAHVARRSPDEVEAPRAQGLVKRAAECHTSNPARTDDCRTLYESIRYSTAAVPNSPRHIVYAGCYISWSKVFSGEQSRLWPGAYDIHAECGFWNGYNAVSGVIRNYLPNGAAECLSGRATGCS